MRRIAATLCLLTAAALGVAACAEAQPRPGGTPSASTLWVTYAAEVSGVTAGPGAQAVTVHVEALAGRDGCSRNVRVDSQEEENGVIFANIVEESATVGNCPTFAPAEVTLTSTEPIGKRPLSLNQKAWALKNGTYTLCDENLGCNPPKDRCDPVWTRAAVRGMDLSRHSQGTVEACDGNWLIMTVPDDPTACGVEARPGCEVNTAVRRYFLRNKPAGWLIIAQTNSGGCDVVVKAASTFPRKLCADLEPTSRLISVAPTLPPGSPPGG
ncbi:hypothetical protein [Micromonospora sp. NPDC005413]|uniref:hypothetical protein n=1 Tax=Micromonospora sp. NPDC005413 TaxID=3154563 RepID=UPI0033AC8F2F